MLWHQILLVMYGCQRFCHGQLLFLFNFVFFIVFGDSSNSKPLDSSLLILWYQSVCCQLLFQIWVSAFLCLCRVCLLQLPGACRAGLDLESWRSSRFAWVFWFPRVWTPVLLISCVSLAFHRWQRSPIIIRQTQHWTLVLLSCADGKHSLWSASTETQHAPLDGAYDLSSLAFDPVFVVWDPTGSHSYAWKMISMSQFASSCVSLLQSLSAVSSLSYSTSCHSPFLPSSSLSLSQATKAGSTHRHPCKMPRFGPGRTCMPLDLCIRILFCRIVCPCWSNCSSKNGNLCCILQLVHKMSSPAYTSWWCWTPWKRRHGLLILLFCWCRTCNCGSWSHHNFYWTAMGTPFLLWSGTGAADWWCRCRLLRWVWEHLVCSSSFVLWSLDLDIRYQSYADRLVVLSNHRWKDSSIENDRGYQQIIQLCGTPTSSLSYLS